MKPCGDWSIDHPGQDNEPDDEQKQFEAEQWAWEMFAQAHPHEAHESDPERFWKFFQTKRPGVSREQMKQCLRDTA